MKLFALLALCMSVLGLAQAKDPFGFGNQNGPKPVEVELVSETHAVVPGQPFYLALKMVHGPGWHTYWTNPGTGMPTKMAWELPEGFEVGPQLSPIPEIKEDVIGNTHIYHGTIYHVYQVTPPADFEAETVTIKGTVSWLQCEKDRCDPPKRAPVDITMAVDTEVDVNAEVKASIDEVLGQQAKALDAWTVSSSQTDEAYTFTLTPGEGANPDPGAVYVFEEEQLLAAETPTVTKDGENIVVTATNDSGEEIGELNGFLYAPNGWLAAGGLPKAMPLMAAAAPATGEVDAVPAANGGDAKYVTLSGEEEVPLSIWKALLFGFIGGAILNLMPCVFPVISIKILGFIDQAGEDSRQVKLHGLVFGAGVLISIWILAGILLGIREATGEQTGWGSHLGNPVVTGVIVILMFALSLNLFGVFEIGTSLMGVGGDLMQKKGYSGSFFSGVLTTVVATPCSGPFLGAVMGFTFSQPVMVAFLLFTVFAIGVATPYMMLSFFPQLINKMPPPGAWMETFKHIMAFPMLAATLFFLNAFGGVAGVSGMVWMMAGMLVIAAGLWVYGKWCAPAKKASTRHRGLAVAVILALIGFYISYGASKYRGSSEAADTGGLVWEEWSPELVRDLRAEGRMMFVDFTASW